MGTAVFGADARFGLLTDMLSENGFDARCISAAQEAEGADILIAKYPFEAGCVECVMALPSGAKLILLNSGSPSPEETGGRKFTCLSDDGVFALENAVLTAEGAVCAAMNHIPFALNAENILVIGYGRIGRSLTEILVGLRARVTVMSRREAGRLQALARGAMSVDADSMKAVLSDARVVFVTTPDRVLGRDELMRLSRSALLIDLSGAPYGVDMAECESLRLNARRESGVPGKYCPESAAKAMYRAVLRAMDGGETA